MEAKLSFVPAIRLLLQNEENESEQEKCRPGHVVELSQRGSSLLEDGRDKQQQQPPYFEGQSRARNVYEQEQT